MTGKYTLRDRLSLWLLTDPADPVLIGSLELLRTRQGVSLRYARSWVERGFALSEDLPLLDQEFLPTDRDTAPGAVDDARPDRWGERVIRFLDKPPRVSLLELLWFAGDERFGALGVSVEDGRYEPRRMGPLPTLADAPAVQDLVMRVLQNEPVPAEQRRLIAPGATMGGARPKALLAIDGEAWVVKFGSGEALDTPLVEHAAMTLARAAGITPAETRPIRLADGHAVAVRRFDRAGRRRIHAQSAAVALRAAGEPMGYPELAQLLRRRGIAKGGVAADQMRELFRRMAFNILLDNTDDHEKNHVVLVDDAGQFVLSPAFDVLPSTQALGVQQMRVGTEQGDATLTNAMSMCASFGLTPAKARAEIRRVIAAIDGWKKHFAAVGVRAGDIASLEEQIDRPFLRDQRRDFA